MKSLIVAASLIAGVLTATVVVGDSNEMQPGSVPELLPPGQQEIVADGVVTRDEYSQAKNRELACERAAGLVVRAIWNPRTSAFMTEVDPGNMSMEDALKIVDDCQRDHLEFVAIAWENQLLPEADEDRQELARLVLCLELLDGDEVPDVDLRSIDSVSGYLTEVAGSQPAAHACAQDR